MVPTAAVLHGQNLRDDGRVALGSGRITTVRRVWQIRLTGSDDLELTPVEHPDTQTLRFTLPGGLAFGRYDVTAVAPNGESLTLPAALTVTEDPTELQLRIETEADGSGEPVAERNVTVGESLDVFAVFRTDRELFVRSDTSAAWSVSGAGELSTPMGVSTRFSSRVLGDAIVRADYADEHTQTGILHVVASAADSVSIEDAPGGTGRRVAEVSTLTTDDTLTLYAVARDRFGNFVADVSGQWTVSGGIAAPAPERAQSRWAVELLRPGMGQVSVTHAEYGQAQTGVLSVAPGRAARLSVRPREASVVSGSESIQFAVDAEDADGNATPNQGVLTWSIAQGPITAIDADSGKFQPRAAGAGRIRVASSHGPQAVSDTVQVSVGRATRLDLGSVPTQLTAGDPPVTLVVRAFDAAGNANADVGSVVWSIVNGSFGTLDPSSGVITPSIAGTGVVRAGSGEDLSVDSLPITILAGRVASLDITPSSAMLTTDSAPLTFQVTGRDANGNLGADIGVITWSIASGSLASLGTSNGVLDPQLAGDATVRATSSHGATGLTGNIHIAPGRAASLTITPNTLLAMVGDPSVTFTTTGRDADGNVTSDLGVLTYSIASGGIAAIDSQSGVFAPQSAGTGSVRSSSSYGVAAVSDVVSVLPFASQVSLETLRAPSPVWQNQPNVRLEVDIKNAGAREAQLSGLWFTFRRSGSDVSSQYVVLGDYRNPDRIPAKSNATLVYYMNVGPSASVGSVEITANMEVFHPQLGATQDSLASDMTVWPVTGPSVSVTAPSVPANRLCANASTLLGSSSASITSLVFAWILPGGTPSTASTAAPTVSYTQVGNFPYELTITDTFAFFNTALGNNPIFVGQVAADPSQAYPTGSLVFSSPALDPGVDMALLPANLIDMAAGPAQDLLQCDGSPVAPNGQRYVTLFVDRGRLDPVIDIRSDLPGIQVALDVGQGHFDNVSLQNGSTNLEGPAMVYGEYFHAGLQRVTAAGSAAFHLTHDTQVPSVTGSLPASDCGAGCAGKGKPWVFRFSEPMNPASFSNISVERLATSACNSSAVGNLNNQSSYAYDAAARTLFVYPASQSASNYTLRVTLGSQLTDAAASPNALTPYVRCAGVTTLPAGATPAAPVVSMVGPNPFSPDGDGVAESTAWNVTVDGATRLLQIRVSRGPNALWATTIFVSGPSSLVSGWDGRDFSGRTLTDGLYRYDVTAYSADALASPTSSGVIEVDSAVHFVGVPRRY